MHSLSAILRLIAILSDFIIDILYLLIILRVIFGWINIYSLAPLRDLIYKITEPILSPLRIILHLEIGGLDLSPLIAFIMLVLIRRYIISWLFLLSSRL